MRLEMTEAKSERMLRQFRSLPVDHPEPIALLRQLEIAAAVAGELESLLSLVGPGWVGRPRLAQRSIGDYTIQVCLLSGRRDPGGLFFLRHEPPGPVALCLGERPTRSGLGSLSESVPCAHTALTRWRAAGGSRKTSSARANYELLRLK